MADTFQDVFGTTPGALGVGAAGTFAGGALNYFFNSKLQDRQFKEQQKLQERAAQMNSQAVFQQAQLQAQGLANAGLNPAAANGQGAPAVQAGAAAGASSQLSTIFDGVAEIVAASKAPSEVENLQADTGKLKEETREVKTRVDDLLPTQVKKLNADIDSVNEQVRSARNFNDAWEAEDGYLRAQTSAVFNSVREQYKSNGRWKKLPERTQKELDDLADGKISVGKGDFEGILKELDLRGRFSDTDRKLVSNAYDNLVQLRQMNNKEVLKSIVNAPKNEQDKIMTDIKHLNALVKEINEGKLPLEKAQKSLADAEKELTETTRKIKELNDALYLANEGRERELDNLTTRESLNNVLQMMMMLMSGLSTLLAAWTHGQAMKDANRAPDIQRPSNKDVEKYGNTYNKVFDLSPQDDKHGPLIYR